MKSFWRKFSNTESFGGTGTQSPERVRSAWLHNPEEEDSGSCFTEFAVPWVTVQANRTLG